MSEIPVKIGYWTHSQSIQLGMMLGLDRKESGKLAESFVVMKGKASEVEELSGGTVKMTDWYDHVAYYLAHADRITNKGKWFVVCATCQSLKFYDKHPTYQETIHHRSHGVWFAMVGNEIPTYRV